MFSKEKLKQRRNEKNLSQTAVANYLNVTRTAYHNWENGKTIPNQKNLILLSEILEVEPRFFESEYHIVSNYLQLNESNQVTYITNISTDIKLLLLSQVYANQLTTRISVLAKKEIKSYTGTIPTISNEQVLLRTQSGYENIPISEIINIQLESEGNHESA